MIPLNMELFFKKENVLLLSFCIITVIIDIHFISVIFGHTDDSSNDSSEDLINIQSKDQKPQKIEKDTTEKPDTTTVTTTKKESVPTNTSVNTSQSPASKAMSSLRWSVTVLRFEKSPFILLTIFSLLSGIISFALICVFTINLFMAQTLDTVDHWFDFAHYLRKNTDFDVHNLFMHGQKNVYRFTEDVIMVVMMVYFAIFFTGFIALHCVSLLWYNYGDVVKLFQIRIPFRLNVFAAHFWRMLHLLTAIIFVVISTDVNGAHNISEVIRSFCQYMALQGLLWTFIYFCTACFCALLIRYKLAQEKKQISAAAGIHDRIVLTDVEIRGRLYPRWWRLREICVALWWVAKCVQFYNRRKYRFLLHLLLISIFYLILKYQTWYAPIWTTMYAWFTGKHRQKSHFDTNNFLQYWKIRRNKSSKKEGKWTEKCCSSLTMFFSFGIIACLVGLAVAGMVKIMPTATEMESDEETEQNYAVTDHFKQQNFSAYPVCDIKFGNTASFSVLDLTFLAMVPYQRKMWVQIQALNIWFGIDQWGVLTKHGKGNPAFTHITNEKHNFDLIVVRGTKTRHDILQDISLFTEVASLQLISFFVPLTTFLPNEFLRDFVDSTNYDIRKRKRFDRPVYDYIAKQKRLSKLLSKENNYTNSIYVLGHSLGGGIAQIVAARFAKEGYKNILSFGVSSPGVALSSKKFAFEIEDLDKTSISVIPRRDVVPKVDIHGGFKQFIACSQASFAECHYLWSSFCELVKSCSSKYVEDRNSAFADCICTHKSGWGGMPRKCYNNKDFLKPAE